MTIPYRVVVKPEHARLGMKLFIVRVSARCALGVAIWDSPVPHTIAVSAW